MMDKDQLLVNNEATPDDKCSSMKAMYRHCVLPLCEIAGDTGSTVACWRDPC